MDFETQTITEIDFRQRTNECLSYIHNLVITNFKSYLILISEQQIQDIASKIGNAVDAKKVYLFGSYAKGEATEQSDVDFFIVMKNRNKKKYEIANELDRIVGNALPVMQDWVIDYQDKVERFSNIRYSFIGHIVTTGKLLYES